MAIVELEESGEGPADPVSATVSFSIHTRDEQEGTKQEEMKPLEG